MYQYKCNWLRFLSSLLFIKYIAITLILEASSLLDFEIGAKEFEGTKSPLPKLPAVISSAESTIEAQRIYDLVSM